MEPFWAQRLSRQGAERTGPFGLGTRSLAAGGRTQTRLVPSPPTAREAPVWEVETHHSPPTQFHFLFVPSFPPTEFSLKRGRAAGVSCPAPARLGACPAGVAPWRALQTRRSGSTGCGPCIDPGPGAPSWAPGAAGDSGPPPRGHAERVPGASGRPAVRPEGLEKPVWPARLARSGAERGGRAA
ncbi:hypothetical protein NN561_006858 [Cricetulus griseus]